MQPPEPMPAVVDGTDVRESIGRSPDGESIAFTADFNGRISVTPADGGDATTLYQREDGQAFLSDWSRVGGKFTVQLSGPPTRGVVISQSPDPDQPVSFDEAQNLDQADFSPDGKWIAYNADRGGGMEVWVVPFPPTGQPRQISSGGGAQAQWSPVSRELFYLSLTGDLMSVPFETEEAGGFRPGRPTRLFQTGLTVDAGVERYAVSSTGEGFLIPTLASTSSPATLVLVQHWLEELKGRVPVR